MRKRRRNTKFSDACPFFFHLSQRFFLAKTNGPSFSSSISIYASLCGYDIISEGASLQLWECIRLLFLTFKKPRYDFYFQICFFSPPRVFFQCLRCCFWKALPFWTNQMTKSPSASLKIFRALVRQPWKRWHSCDINAPVALPRWGPRSIMMWYLCFFWKGRTKGERVYFWKLGLYDLDENGFVSNIVEVMRLCVFVLIAIIDFERWSRYIFEDGSQGFGNWEGDLCKWCSLVSH